MATILETNDAAAFASRGLPGPAQRPRPAPPLPVPVAEIPPRDRRWRVMSAGFPARCRRCRAAISVGERIGYRPRMVICDRCVGAELERGGAR